MRAKLTYDGTGRVLDDGSAKYVYGAGMVDQKTNGGVTYYYLADGLGSTMKTVDQSANVVNAYTYDVYGKTTSSSGSQANTFQFAGQQTDSTGLQYLRARYYDPASGTFLSRDPMAAGPSWSGNPFGYAGGSPTNATDPSGLSPHTSPNAPPLYTLPGYNACPPGGCVPSAQIIANMLASPNSSAYSGGGTGASAVLTAYRNQGGSLVSVVAAFAATAQANSSGAATAAGCVDFNDPSSCSEGSVGAGGEDGLELTADDMNDMADKITWAGIFVEDGLGTLGFLAWGPSGAIIGLSLGNAIWRYTGGPAVALLTGLSAAYRCGSYASGGSASAGACGLALTQFVLGLYPKLNDPNAAKAVSWTVNKVWGGQ